MILFIIETHSFLCECLNHSHSAESTLDYVDYSMSPLLYIQSRLYKVDTQNHLRILNRDRPRTLALDQASILTNQAVEVAEQSLDRHHFHQAQSGARRLQRLTTKQNTHIVSACVLGHVLLLLVELKDNLAPHTRPDHLVDLQDAEHAAGGSVVRKVVEVDGLGLALDHGTQVTRQLGNPHAVRGRRGSKGGECVAVYLRILPLTHAVDSVGHLLINTGG